MLLLACIMLQHAEHVTSQHVARQHEGIACDVNNMCTCGACDMTCNCGYNTNRFGTLALSWMSCTLTERSTTAGILNTDPFQG